MKILIVSKEVWRDDQNGGNTLSSIFSAFPEDTEFAQIFCSEGNPDNNVCTKYFKMSTSDIARAIKTRSEAGCEIQIDKAADSEISAGKENSEKADTSKTETITDVAPGGLIYKNCGIRSGYKLHNSWIRRKNGCNKNRMYIIFKFN